MASEVSGLLGCIVPMLVSLYERQGVSWSSLDPILGKSVRLRVTGRPYLESKVESNWGNTYWLKWFLAKDHNFVLCVFSIIKIKSMFIKYLQVW